jgi:CRISPR-associated protein Cas6
MERLTASKKLGIPRNFRDFANPAVLNALRLSTDDTAPLAIHASPTIGVHSIRGSLIEPGFLELNDASELTIRAPVDLLPKLLPLSGKKLDIAGCPFRLGVPKHFGASPAPSVRAHVVTTKGYLEISQFEGAVRRKPDILGVRDSLSVSVDRRRVIRMRGQTIVGFGLRLDSLSDHESICAQQSGSGGRRHFGCGLFYPVSMEVKA